jgi:hypothetical protein
MNNTKEISKNLETINNVISIIGAIALCTSIAVHIIGWDRHSVLAKTASTTLWLALAYTSVFDPLIQNKKKGYMFWFYLILMAITPALFFIFT